MPVAQITKLPIGLYSKLEEVEMLLTNCLLRVLTVSEAATHPEPPRNRHCVYKVTMKNGQMWAIDVTGAQYGYLDTLCPWSQYERERCDKIDSIRAFGYFRNQPKDPYGLLKGAKMAEEMALTEALDDQIPRWAQEYGGALNIILKGPEVTFRL